MPCGEKSKDTDKQKRRVEHIEGSYENCDIREDEAERRVWTTVNTSPAVATSLAPAAVKEKAAIRKRNRAAKSGSK